MPLLRSLAVFGTPACYKHDAPNGACPATVRLFRFPLSIRRERPVPPQAHSLSAPFDAIAGEREHPDCHLQQVLDQGHPTKNRMLTGPGQSLLEIDYRPNPRKPASKTYN